MPTYDITASITCLGSYTVEAESEEEALEYAYELDASDFDLDLGTGEVEFNVSPTIVVR